MTRITTAFSNCMIRISRPFSNFHDTHTLTFLRACAKCSVKAVPQMQASVRAGGLISVTALGYGGMRHVDSYTGQSTPRLQPFHWLSAEETRSAVWCPLVSGAVPRRSCVLVAFALARSRELGAGPGMRWQGHQEHQAPTPEQWQHEK